MSANENTGDKMKKALKRIWDGPVESKASAGTQKEEILKAEVPENTFSAENEPNVNAAPPSASENFNNMIKANLLKFETSNDSAKKEENLFAPYDEGKEGRSAMMNDAAIDNTTDIFSAAPVSAKTKVTTISKGTSIVGELHSDSDIEMLGNMKGNILTKGNINVCGKVLGDIKGANIDLTSCTVQGNIIAAGTLNIDSDSVLIGDIRSENLLINGKLKGNAQIKNMITCQNAAIILGNVTAAVASINEGAKLQGSMQIINGQIAEIKISEDEAANWAAKTPDSISTIIDK